MIRDLPSMHQEGRKYLNSDSSHNTCPHQRTHPEKTMNCPGGFPRSFVSKQTALHIECCTHNTQGTLVFSLTRLPDPTWIILMQYQGYMTNIRGSITYRSYCKFKKWWEIITILMYISSIAILSIEIGGGYCVSDIYL